jgi:hypothetical protein
LLLVHAALAAFVSLEVLGLSVSGDGLNVRRVSGDLHVSVPRLHFLSGKSLDNLHDGAAVPFDFQLTIAAGIKSNIAARALERFVVSYDVWEERFSVVRLRDLRKSGRNLSMKAAESWCVDNISVPEAGLPTGRDLWARLEVRTAEPRDQGGTLVRDPGINIATLIDIFSRSPRAQQEHWSFESAPFRISDPKQ